MGIEDDLYQDVILEHYRSREFRGRLDGAGVREARGENPACGDRLQVFARLEGERVVELAYEGAGCAICCAAANMICSLLRGKDVASVRAVMGGFRDMLVSEAETVEFDDEFEELEALRGVREYPTRIKCALLPWEALGIILKRGNNE